MHLLIAEFANRVLLNSQEVLVRVATGQGKVREF